MTGGEKEDELPEQGQTSLVTHLLELRDRLLRIVLSVLLIFILLFPFANQLYAILAEPLLVHLPRGSSMIAVEVISPFLTPLKMAFFASLFIAMPYILYQVWAFVAPGLYAREKRLAVPLLVSSVILFYLGVSFAYFIVFPLVFDFLINVAPEGVSVMTDISKYLDFVLALFFAFGFAFEVPVATIILIATGVTTVEALENKRPYIFVGAFVIGMLLTPPDVISQIMLAVPMWLLFEVGIFMSRFLLKPVEEEDPADVRPSSMARRTATATAGTTRASDYPPPATTTEPAYPDDYEPLTDEELEAELDAAEKWDEESEENNETDNERTSGKNTKPDP